MGEWKEIELGELVVELTVGHVGPMASEYREHGIPFIRSTDIEPFRIKREQLKFIDNEFHERLNKSALGPGDVLIVRTGKPGTCAMIPDDIPIANCSDVVIARSGPELLPRYLTYYINSMAQAHIEAYSVGAVQQHFNVGAAREMPIKLPTIEEQEAIIEVLGSLDAKIDLLHRQNKTLEGMAEALFREWFVERAEDEWEEYGLLDLVQLVPGGTPKTQEAGYWDGDIMWISVREISENHKGFINYSYKYITEDGLQNSAANLLPKYGTVISARGTVGKIGLLAQPMAYSQSNFGILPKDGANFFFTYLLVHNSIEELHSNSYGAVFDTITTRSFQTIRHWLPSMEVINSFEALIDPTFKKMLNNTEQIASLTTLRDTLLPKLMSGEVGIRR